MIRVDNKGAMATRLMMPVLGIADGRIARRDHPSDPILHC